MCDMRSYPGKDSKIFTDRKENVILENVMEIATLFMKKKAANSIVQREEHYMQMRSTWLVVVLERLLYFFSLPFH